MRQTATQGVIGLAGSLAWVTMAQFDLAVRVAGSVVGLLIGLVTLVSMLRKLRKGGG